MVIPCNRPFDQPPQTNATNNLVVLLEIILTPGLNNGPGTPRAPAFLHVAHRAEAGLQGQPALPAEGVHQVDVHWIRTCQLPRWFGGWFPSIFYQGNSEPPTKPNSGVPDAWGPTVNPSTSSNASKGPWRVRLEHWRSQPIFGRFSAKRGI